MPTADRPPGRPADPAKREAMLDSAWALFLSQGVEATSMEAVAARASVSKVTLYKAFADKTALFQAAVLREMERIEAAQRPMAEAGDMPIEARLRAFGLGIMTYLASPPAVDFYNVVAGDLRRHPALARAFYDLGPGRTRANLAALIESAMARGELSTGDPFAASEALFGLWQGFSNFQHALGVEPERSQAGLAEQVEAGVAAFLRLYARR